MSCRKAFSLIELLVVVTIIGAMIALTTPSMSNILGGAKVSTGGETVFGALSNARQLAATKNREIEFRLIEMQNPDFPGTAKRIRAVQILEIRENGTYQVGKVRVLPSGVIIGSSSQMSSICALNNTQATASDPSIPRVDKDYSYRSFHFRPDGSLNLGILLPSVTNYFLTIYDEKFESQISGSTPPKNFATIQLEPATGAAVLYKP